MQDGKRVQLLIGERVNRFVPNPTFDPIIVPGCLDAFFRGQIPEGVDRRSLMKVEPLREEYRDRDKRVAVVESQGLESVLLFPTLGCGVEQALRHDVDATMASLHAFNRWLEEDWGFVYRDRLISAPMLSLADPDAAGEELDSLLSARSPAGPHSPGARTRSRTGPRARSGTRCTTRSGLVSPRRRFPSPSIWATAATTSSRPHGEEPRNSRASVPPTCSAGSSSPTGRSTTPSRRW